MLRWMTMLLAPRPAARRLLFGGTALAMLLASCSLPGAGSGTGPGSAALGGAPSAAARITIAPSDRAQGIALDTPIVVSVASGWLKSVNVQEVGVDDLVYDPPSQRIYVACGEGFVNVYHQVDADHYQSIGKIATGPLGKTGLLVPELKKYFVAVPPHGAAAAEVLVFAVQ